MTHGEDGDPEHERQRARIEDAFRHGWRPADAGQPRGAA
jgi:hypothetical protein